MGLKYDWVLRHIEFKNTNVVGVLACKQVAAMRKNNFFAGLYWKDFIGTKRFLKDVHHFYLVSEPNYKVEAAWMKCDAKSVFREMLVNLQTET